LWEAETGQLLRVLEGHQDPVLSVAWSPQGLRLASGSADRAVRLWEAETGQLLRVLQGHQDAVRIVVWSPEGRRLGSGSADRTIRLWEAETGQLLRVLEGHQARVRSVAWSPEGRRLASGSAEGTIRVWEAETGQLVRVLEGHQAGVECVAWSPEGETLASTSLDGEVRIWRSEDGSLLGKFEPTEYKYVGLEVAWRAQRPLASTLWDEAIFLRAWAELDLRAPAAAPLPEQVRVSTAKVVLVGESDIGKSCFALRLLEDRYEERGTTHGMQVWTLPAQKLDPVAEPPPGVRREVFFWDMGGQPEYRLVHQLFFHDSNICLFFFDPTRGEKAFDEVREWNLRLESQLQGRKATKLLIRTKLDLGGHVDRARIESLREECRLGSYHEVSAKEGTGVPEVRSALNQVLDWAQAEQITRDLFFQQVRDFVGRARERGEVILYYPDLASRLRREFPKEFDAKSLDTVLGQLSLQGLVVDLRLGTGDRVVVLRVDAVERYAGSIVLAARDNPRRVPAVEHADIVSARMALPGMKEDERLPRGDERVVLEAVVQLLIEHGICFLHQGLLVFPSLLAEAGAVEPEELPHRVPVYYDFSGAIDNIYASLVTTLAWSGGFGPVRLWTNRAEYQETGRGLFGLRKGDDRPGLAHMDLYFDDAAPTERRDVFVSLVEEHLRREGVTIKESLAFTCDCRDQRFEDTALRKLLAAGETEIVCPYCKTRYSLFAGAEKARAERPELSHDVVALRTRRAREAERAVEHSKREFAEAAAATPRPDGPIRILHLSDLHLKAGDDAVVLFEPLLADLRRSLSTEKLDYLVLSGDLANKANPEGFDIAREFLSKLVEEFGLSAERSILVPGNHDQTWDPIPYRLQLSPGSAPAGHYVKEGNVYRVRDDDLYPKRFALFARCYHIFKTSDYPLEFGSQGTTAFFDSTGILFLGLSSAWQVDVFNPKRSSIHESALSKALLEAGKAQGPVLRIAVTHHAITGNDKIVDDAFVGRLVQAGFRLYLHGDVHEGREQIWNPYAPKDQQLHVIGAGSLNAEAGDRPEATPRLYNLLEISRDLRELRVHTRKQDRKGGPWEPFPKWPVPGGAHARRAYIDIELA
jgi:GTPase SAR1 family protein